MGVRFTLWTSATLEPFLHAKHNTVVACAVVVKPGQRLARTLMRKVAGRYSGGKWNKWE